MQPLDIFHFSLKWTNRRWKAILSFILPVGGWARWFTLCVSAFPSKATLIRSNQTHTNQTCNQRYTSSWNSSIWKCTCQIHDVMWFVFSERKSISRAPRRFVVALFSNVCFFALHSQNYDFSLIFQTLVEKQSCMLNQRMAFVECTFLFTPTMLKFKLIWVGQSWKLVKYFSSNQNKTKVINSVGLFFSSLVYVFVCVCECECARWPECG